MKIGEVLEKTGLTDRAVRLYIEHGLISPTIEKGYSGRKSYVFSEEDVQKLDAAGKIVEMRQYNTVYGLWKYFTVNDGNIRLDEEDYLLIVTVEGYVMVRDYFGADRVVPIYIEVEDGQRLLRAIAREQEQDIPKYEEMCRRFLADSKDFSEENILAAGITQRFYNVDLESTIAEIKSYIVAHK